MIGRNSTLRPITGHQNLHSIFSKTRMSRKNGQQRQNPQSLSFKTVPNINLKCFRLKKRQLIENVGWYAVAHHIMLIKSFIHHADQVSNLSYRSSLSPILQTKSFTYRPDQVFHPSCRPSLSPIVPIKSFTYRANHVFHISCLSSLSRSGLSPKVSVKSFANRTGQVRGINYDAHTFVLH